MKKIILKIIVIIITIGIIYEGYGMIKEFTSKNKLLEEVSTKEIFDNKKNTLSIVLIEENGSYEEAKDRNSWPDENAYKYYKSECSDSNGVIIPSEEMITYQDKTINIKTNKTIYCTLYFADKNFKPLPPLEMLDKKGGEYYAGGKTGDQKELVDELYRFVGTKDQVTNNYICLGDENPDVCKADSENMYRIIGVTTDGQLKVIRATKYINKGWFNSNEDGKWNESELYTYLNETFYTLLDVRIKELIEKHTWNMEFFNGFPWDSSTIESEGTVTNNIGLMYGSDYVNAGAQDTTNWLFIQNGYSGNPVENEWTMSRYFYHYGYWNAWDVVTDGTLSYPRVNNTLAVRPVFYLAPDITLSGEGKVDTPYIVTGIRD